MKKVLLAGIAACAIGVGVAYAQLNPPLSMEQQMGQSDAMQVIPGGTPQRANTYVAPGQVGAMDNYVVAVPLTAFTITPANTTTWEILNPAGTLATGTLTMPAQPSDGGRFCISSTQTQTALTVTANTGQTLKGTAVTALVANAPPSCWRWVAALSDWFALQ